jgi:hypothetical protein
MVVSIAATSPSQPRSSEREGWPREVEGLQVSLLGATSKLAHLDGLVKRTTTAVQLGMPTVGQITDTRRPTA